ncbi:MAG: DNA methyltransferase [Planctomycetota bacterium]
MAVVKKMLKALADLKPAPWNPRSIQPENLAALGYSLEEFGDLSGIVWNQKTGNLVCGHQRLRALQEKHGDALKLKAGAVLTPEGERFPVRVVDWPKAKEKAANVAANSPTLMGEFTAGLGDVLGEVKIAMPEQFEALRLGEIDFERTEREPVEEDPIPEPPEEPETKLGEIFELGPHRVMCGDCTKAEDVVRLLNGEKAALCFTSPPYLQQRDYTDASDCSDWDGLMQGCFGQLDAAMADDGQVLVNLGLVHRDNEWIPYWDSWIEWMRGRGWRRFAWYVWDQLSGMPGDWSGRLAPAFEFVFHFNRMTRKPAHCVPKDPRSIDKTGTHTFRQADGTMKAAYSPHAMLNTHKIPDAVIRLARAHTAGQIQSAHPACFPVGLPAYGMAAWDGIVYDPFLGSGTTLIAADQLGRICYGMDVEPKYVDVTVRRYINHVGRDKADPQLVKRFCEENADA